MNDIIKIIVELEGVIGAIFGTISTLIVTDILRRKGKLEIFIINSEGNFYYNDLGFRSKEKKENTNLDYYSFELEFSAYNKSDIPKIMRDIKVALYIDNKLLIETNVRDEETRRYGNHSSYADYAKIYNIDPKKADIFKFTFHLDKEEANKLIDKDALFKLKYYNEKKKRKDFIFYDGKIKEPEITKK